MIADARDVPKGSGLDTDVCIVGAGAAGITLARELARTKLRVVVLESGGLEFDPNIQALDSGPNIGLPYFPLDAARLRYFGGTTNHWGGVCRPFDAADFDAKDWVPRSGWPLTRTDIAPYYDRARVICHVTTGDWSVAGWRRRDRFDPLDFDSDVVVTRPAQVVARSDRSFGRAYRIDIRRAATVTAYLHATVTELVADALVTRIESVNVATLEGNAFTVTARIFVLATGALENARLLLLSDRQQPGGLGNQYDLVGRHFLEHPRFQAAVIVPSRDLSIRFYEQHRVGNARVQGYLALSRKRQRAEQIVDVQARLEPIYDRRFAEALESRDIASIKALARAARHARLPRHVGRHLAIVLDDLTTWRKFVVRGAPLPIPYPEVIRQVQRESPRERRTILPELLGDIAAVAAREITTRAPLQAIAVVTRVEPVPNPSSRVTLVDERDALGLRKIALDWRLSPLDKHSARRTLEILGAEVARAGLGRLRITMDDRDDTWPDDLAGGWHHMGTTRMNDDPKQGVVDRNLRVHGLANLFVAGSSVFPTAGSGTPTMLIVALALRLAEHLPRALA